MNETLFYLLSLPLMIVVMAIFLGLLALVDAARSEEIKRRQKAMVGHGASPRSNS